MKKVRNWTIVGMLLLSSFLYLSFDDIDDYELIKRFDIYHTIFRELKLFYVDEVDYPKLVEKSIDEMLKSLDPYTVYFPESEIEDYRFMTTGEYGGIGATVQEFDNKIVITEIYNGFSAQKAGLKVGDIIVEIADQKVTPQNMYDVSLLLKGQVNEAIHIKIMRPPANNELVFSLMREKVFVSSVPYHGMINDTVGYILLTSFTEHSGKYVRDAFLDLKKNNNLKSVVLDLRNNPGGLLIEAVKIVNVFVEKGKLIVSTRGKLKEWNSEFYTTENAVDTKIPLAVLVNRSSASASEIVAGAIQDLDRGVVIGQRTYGKGLVQSTRDLTYNAKLKLTTAKYYIPSGRCIQALDYSHRNEDGSVGTVPDSLITKFQTSKGRIVYDGGGVLPDVVLESENLSKISIELIQKNYLFDFATLFSTNNHKIDKPENFKISEEKFNEFKKYLDDKDLNYKTQSQKLLDELIKVSKSENYFDKIDAQIKTLTQKLGHDTERDLNIFKPEIKELLEREIVGRYYYFEGKIRYDLKKDPWINQSVIVLADKKKMTFFSN